MWINFEKKIIYLCNPKCASTTVRKQLRQQNFINLGKKLQENFKGRLNHSPMKIIVKYLKHINENPYHFTYFTLIREPIDRLISNFNYCCFDKDWIPRYSDSEKHNYTINDYLSVGLEKSSNINTHPMRIIDFTEILDKNFNIHIFKVENLDECRNFLKNFNISFDINLKKNVKNNKNDIFEIKNTITKENLEKIYNLYKYEYTHYYKHPL